MVELANDGISDYVGAPGGSGASGQRVGTGYRPTRIAKAALGALDAAGGILSWQNPEGVDIIVSRIELDVTTPATGACTADFGATATSGATSIDNLIDGLDVNAAAGLFSNAKNPGTNGKADQRLAAGKWITGSKASGAAAGLVGSAYIHYHCV